MISKQYTSHNVARILFLLMVIVFVLVKEIVLYLYPIQYTV